MSLWLAPGRGYAGEDHERETPDVDVRRSWLDTALDDEARPSFDSSPPGHQGPAVARCNRRYGGSRVAATG